MSDEPYPSPNVSRLVQRVRNLDTTEIARDWTGNDNSRRNQTGIVDLGESPLRLRLSWKKSPKDSVHLIGVYDLYLEQLRLDGYVRDESTTKNKIRLRFYHAHDGLIYIQVNSNGPKLPIGYTGP